MKILQNDLTTPEQSKRLIELGVPKNSANHYGKDGKLHYIDGTIPYSLLWETGCTPYWSVGRLIEIMLNSQIDTGTYALGFMLDKDTFSIESLIDIIDEDIKEFDFSKLED